MTNVPRDLSFRQKGIEQSSKTADPVSVASELNFGVISLALLTALALVVSLIFPELAAVDFLVGP